jgi:hypothetical protein
VALLGLLSGGSQAPTDQLAERAVDLGLEVARKLRDIEI